jgi:hypothetical protein
MVPSIETRNTVKLTTQNTGQGEAVLGEMLGTAWAMVAGEDVMVWLFGAVMESPDQYMRICSNAA